MVPKSGIDTRAGLGMSRWLCTGEVKGRDMPMLLGDLLLFSGLAVWVFGIVLVIASLLS
jgi:hypothetical protein